MSRDFKVAIGAVFLFAAGLVVYDRFFRPTSPAAERQRVNIAAVEEELPKVRSVLGSDPRFKNVEASVTTGDHGALALLGTVEHDEDLFLLMKAIAAESVRAPVSWRVQVQVHE